MKKLVSLVLAAAMVLSLSCSAWAAPIINSFNLSDNWFEDQLGWYFTSDVSLVLQDESNYELFFRRYTFGTTDPGLKGNKLIVYSGTYTSVPAEDGEPSHLDITLDTCDSIYFEQHGKAFGRNVLAYAMVLDTASWDDMMTDIAFPSGSDDPAAEFVANHSVAGTTFTVEDLRLDYDDVTLENRILALPEGFDCDITE